MDLPQKVRAPNPWAFFGYFLSQQKVTPRRGGETRQMAFRTRQDCEGADCRVAVKGNKTITYQNTVPRTERQPVQEADLWACLEGQTHKIASAWRSPRLGVGRSRSGRGLSLRTNAKRKDSSAILSVAPYFLPRPMWKDTASSRSISPDLRAKSLAALGCAPKRACGRSAAGDQALSALDPDRTYVR